MMRPPPFLTRCGATARMALQVPVRLTSIVSCQSASCQSRIGLNAWMPAFANRMSSRPKAARACSAAARSAGRSTLVDARLEVDRARRRTVEGDGTRFLCSSTGFAARGYGGRGVVARGAADGMAPGTVIPITARWRERRPLASAPRRSERRRPARTITPTPIRTTLRRHRRPAAITPIRPATEARGRGRAERCVCGVRIARVR